MISSNLVVEGVPGSQHHHHHHHALAGVGGHPLQFSAIHHLNQGAVGSTGSHLMSAAMFSEPSSFLKTGSATLLPTPEFLRPLPKPAPIVAGARYNAVTSSFNGNIKSRAGKYAESESQGPVSLVHQLKESSASSVHTGYSIYTSSRLYPAPGPPFSHYGPPPSTMQSGPYNTLYPSNPFGPLMTQRDNRSTHLMEFQHTESNIPIIKSPPSSAARVGNNSSVKSVYKTSVAMATTTTELNNRGEKRPFKVPSGKEGSLKHRILQTRHEAARVQKKPSSVRSSTGPVVSIVHGNDISASSTEEMGVTAIVTNSADGVVNGSSESRNGTTLHNFSKGSLIKLASGDFKKVEDMQTEDFVLSAEKSSTYRIDPSTVVRIQEKSDKRGTATLTLSYNKQRLQVDYETVVEHPYFVFEHGWSSCAPEITRQIYGLKCRQLQVGDVCVTLSPKLSCSSKLNIQKKDSTIRKLPAQQQQQILQNSHFTNRVDIKAFTQKKNDLRINNSTDGEGLKHFTTISNTEMEATKYDNDTNNNTNKTSDKHDGPGFLCKKRRRWSAPDQITEEYQSSPLSSPLSSTCSNLSSSSSVGSSKTT